MSRSKSVILLPPVLIWSLFYGVIGGLFFKLLSVYELWLISNRYHIRQWKRYPMRHYQQFTSAVLMGRMAHKSWSTLPLTRNQIGNEYARAPFPFLIIMCNTLLALLYLPFALLSGVFIGPSFVFTQFWQRLNPSPSAGIGY